MMVLGIFPGPAIPNLIRENIFAVTRIEKCFKTILIT